MKLKYAVIGLSLFGGITLVANSAWAIPNGLPEAGRLAGDNANLDQVRWVCNPWGRCHWRPNFYGAYGYYGPRFYGPPPWGWRTGIAGD
ncbi:hypothetical protein [Bradyrhizobium erythrophlei]|uniref:Uncharacterized protein n=1 Tax=Bradyrhizobium erythrophlei TaxID=1437360 RepID=A0A1H4YCN7_9BRAD|nr:hypothetical protein [Bradyrhizobium erythrophlei]SED14858.1 hypothetical protein SAMN05444164_3857 [Bradyrhizobium erythrophlei]